MQLWNKHPVTYLYGTQLREWTKKMHKLTKRIPATHRKSKQKTLRIVRAGVRKKVRRERIREMQQKRVDDVIKVLEENKGNKRAFEAERLLKKGNRRPNQLQEYKVHL